MKKIILMTFVMFIASIVAFYGMSGAQEQNPESFVSGKVAVKLKNPDENGRIYTSVDVPEATTVSKAKDKAKEVKNKDSNIEIAEPLEKALPSQVDPDDTVLEDNPDDVVTTNDETWFSQGFQDELKNVESDETWPLKGGSGGSPSGDPARNSIGIVDTGILNSHNDLNISKYRKIVAEKDFYENDAVAQDEYNHGTGVASIAGAADDGFGMLGAAPNTRIYDARVCGPTNAEGCPVDDQAEAIRWLADQGVKIINMSLGGPSSDPAGPQVTRDAINYANGKGTLIVASAGNENSDAINVFPSCFGESAGDTVHDDLMVISVASAKEDGSASSTFSNGGPCVDIIAPGENIVRASATGDDLYFSNSQGTSYASPIVAGGAKQVKSKLIAAGKNNDRVAVGNKILNNARNFTQLSDLNVPGNKWLSVICAAAPTNDKCKTY